MPLSARRSALPWSKRYLRSACLILDCIASLAMSSGQFHARGCRNNQAEGKTRQTAVGGWYRNSVNRMLAVTLMRNVVVHAGEERGSRFDPLFDRRFHVAR